jgi:FkbM family methyltransferase
MTVMVATGGIALTATEIMTAPSIGPTLIAVTTQRQRRFGPIISGYKSVQEIIEAQYKRSLEGAERECMNQIEDLSHILELWPSAISNVGMIPTCQWTFGRLQKTLRIGAPRFLSVQPRFLKHPVRLRARTSDPFIFQQIMIEDEYLPLKGLRVETILDLGANIGLASAWFLSCFPQSAVFAVEADADNFALCCENMTLYGSRVRVLHGAAWSRRAQVKLRRKSSAADNSVQEAGIGDPSEIQLEAWDLASLIEMSGFDHVDLLKIDIEGAEAEIFSAGVSTWLPYVHNLCIELHGDACRDIFFRAMAGYQFEHTRSGELDLCTRIHHPEMRK